MTQLLFLAKERNNVKRMVEIRRDKEFENNRPDSHCNNSDSNISGGSELDSGGIRFDIGGDPVFADIIHLPI